MLMDKRDFDYDLPEHRIAQRPPARRSASRLLHLLYALMHQLSAWRAGSTDSAHRRRAALPAGGATAGAAGRGGLARGAFRGSAV